MNVNVFSEGARKLRNLFLRHVGSIIHSSSLDSSVWLYVQGIILKTPLSVESSGGFFSSLPSLFSVLPRLITWCIYKRTKYCFKKSKRTKKKHRVVAVARKRRRWMLRDVFNVSLRDSGEQGKKKQRLSSVTKLHSSRTNRRLFFTRTEPPSAMSWNCCCSFCYFAVLF